MLYNAELWNSNRNAIELLLVAEFRHFIEIQCSLNVPKRLRKKANIPWVNADIKAKLFKRDFLKRKAIKTNKEEDWLLFKSSRNAANIALRHSKKEYYTKKLNNNKQNPKKAWRTIKKMVYYNHFQKCWDTSRFSLKYCKTSIPLTPYSMLNRNCHKFVLAIDIQTYNTTLNGGGGGGEGGQILDGLIVERQM